MFFRKQQKKESKKIKKTIEHSIVRNQYRVDSKVLKNITQDKLDFNSEVVVSLTTYSKRILDVYLVLESLAQQTVRPNKVVLWLSEDEFALSDLPLSLTSRIDFGLDVRFCEDTKSYKKIIPTLQSFPNSIIVTLDDDIIYPSDTLEILLKEHKKHPESIIGNRAHEVAYSNGKLMPYKKWKKEISENTDNVFLTGCGAILYPPESLHPDVIRSDLFMSMCPYADDVWLYFMAKLNGTDIRKVEGRKFKDFVEVPSESFSGLNKLNVDKGYNDTQIKSILSHYNL